MGSYRKDVIYPVGTEVLYDPHSGDYMPLNGPRAFIGIVVQTLDLWNSMYTLRVPEAGYPGMKSGSASPVFHKYVQPHRVMTPEDYVQYRENVRTDINLRRALSGKEPNERMDEDYVQWVRDAYTRSGKPIPQAWLAAGGVSA